MFDWKKTILKSIVNWAKTFAAGYGVGLAYDQDTISISVAMATLTSLVTAARNWYKNKDL